MKERLEGYIAGMKTQLEEAKKQAAMIEGAIQFAYQLIEDIEKEETEACEPSPSLVSQD